MLNIDGVIHGNHRTDLVGLDGNRQWVSPSKSLTPIIHYTKQLAKMVCQEREISVYCDMHGHYYSSGDFMYCNTFDKEKIVPTNKRWENA